MKVDLEMLRVLLRFSWEGFLPLTSGVQEIDWPAFGAVTLCSLDKSTKWHDMIESQHPEGCTESWAPLQAHLQSWCGTRVTRDYGADLFEKSRMWDSSKRLTQAEHSALNYLPSRSKIYSWTPGVHGSKERQGPTWHTAGPQNKSVEWITKNDHSPSNISLVKCKNTEPFPNCFVFLVTEGSSLPSFPY